MERWSGGAVERWNGGAVERWSGGTVERWSGGTRLEGDSMPSRVSVHFMLLIRAFSRQFAAIRVSQIVPTQFRRISLELVETRMSANGRENARINSMK